MIHSLAKFELCCVLFAAFSAASAARPALARTGAPPEALPALVAEATAQFQLAYRSQPAEGQYRKEQLNAVIAAWRVSPPSATNDECLSNWLRAAIRSSMPGSREKLPPVPAFTASDNRLQHSTSPAAVRTPAPFPTRTPQPMPAITSAEHNPFRDD